MVASAALTTPHAVDAPAFSERNGTLYSQIANIMRQRIRSGQWPAGTQLPTLGCLEAEFGVARVTLRQALSILEADGLIWRRQGRGTFVSDSPNTRWLRIESRWDALVQSLERLRPRLVNFSDEPSVPRLDEGQARPAPGYRHMRRVHETGGTPYAVIDIYLDQRLYRLAPNRFDSEMVIPVLESLPDVRLGRATQTLRIGAADLPYAEHLRLPVGAPVGLMRRIIEDEAGTAAYVGDLCYRGDLVELEITLRDGPET